MRHFTLAALLCLTPTFAVAGPADFTTGPVIENYGPAAIVPGAQPIPADQTFRIAFDAAKASENGKPNRTLESAARFLNMHARAGVEPDRIDLAVVVHGPAAMDLLKSESYTARHDGAVNPNTGLIDALTTQGVRIILCGQTAAYRDVGSDDLLPSVELALSAMTAHAQLQQDEYTVNPF